jgi:hypothetical protein
MELHQAATWVLQHRRLLIIDQHFVRDAAEPFEGPIRPS